LDRHKRSRVRLSVGVLRLAAGEQDRFACVVLPGELDAAEVNGFERELVRLEQADRQP